MSKFNFKEGDRIKYEYKSSMWGNKDGQVIRHGRFVHLLGYGLALVKFRGDYNDTSCVPLSKLRRATE